MLQVSSQIKLFFLQTAKTGSGIWPASQSFGTRGSVPGNKAKADHFFPFSLEAKNEWSYTSISRICLHREYRHNFYNFNIAVLKTSDGQKSVLSFPVAATALFLLESVQIASWFDPASCSLGTKCPFDDKAEGKGGCWCVTLTTHVNLVLSLRIYGAVPPVLHMSSLCGR